jgi:DNA modification methylase
MELNTIYNEDCIKTMETLVINNDKVDCIITSPPYNMTKRKGGYADSGRYDVYTDWKPEEEYISWTVDIFNMFDRILNENRTVIYNFSYSIENPALPYKLVANIEEKTNFSLIDTIIWKKKSGLPFPANGKRLSRNWEFIFIFARKNELSTYENNRKIKSISEKTGQQYYEAIYNFIEAPNNDGKCSLNQATFSSELCVKLFDIYCKKDWIVYDPFMGTGTTGVAAKKYGMNFIGSELSKAQCEYALKRINEYEKRNYKRK